MHRSVTVAEELARELQVECPKVGVHIEHMELPVPDDKDACLLSDVDKGRVARLEVCLCMWGESFCKQKCVLWRMRIGSALCVCVCVCVFVCDMARPRHMFVTSVSI